MNNFVGDGNGYIGNLDLEPEKAYTVSATVDWHATDRGWVLKATPFYTRVADYIDAIRCEQGAACTPTNATTTDKFVVLQYVNQSARLYGLDLSGHVPLAKNDWGEFGLTGLLNYTNGKNRDTGDEFYNIMPLNAKVALTHRLGGWDGAVEVVGAMAKDDTSDVRNEIKTAGYGLANLRGSYSWKHARVDVGVENLFDRFYLDRNYGGYFSHLDPVTLDPLSEALGANKGKKNWNSVGDHAPAYLINLYLATGEDRYARMLEYTFDTIAKYFPNYEESPFVQEKFFEDWSRDRTHMWQQNRGVVGHNLKIAWNLMRMQSLKAKPEYEALARKIAEVMPAIGGDQQRGGWYDVMERERKAGEDHYRFAFHDRKAWWQQEQGILAYLILNGVLGGDEYLRIARESAAFYNAFFLDHNDGAVYFNVLANGIAYLIGTERFKGSHSMSMYHSGELAYLAQVYTNLLITKQPLDLYFKPLPGAFKRNILRVSPDILPPGSIRIGAVEINDQPYTNFDAAGLTVKLPDTKEQVRVKVRIEPTGK